MVHQHSIFSTTALLHSFRLQLSWLSSLRELHVYTVSILFYSILPSIQPIVMWWSAMFLSSYSLCSLLHQSSPPSHWYVTIYHQGVIGNSTQAYGLVTEQARLLLPKMAFVQVRERYIKLFWGWQIETFLLLVLASLSILAMSTGIELTNALFGLLFRYIHPYSSVYPIRVPVVEADFGPIWPFILATLCFFAAATCVWYV